MIRMLISLICLLLLTGCNLFSPQKTPEISNYTFSVHSRHYHSSASNLKKIAVFVNTPTAITGYDTRKMIYSTKPYQLDHFALNQWSAPPSEMLQPIMVQKLRDTGKINAVMSNEYNTNQQYILRLHLIELRQNFMTKPSQIQLKIQAEILSAHNINVINTHTFSTSITAPQDTPYGGVIAANKAVELLLNQITEFTVHSLDKK